MKNLKLVTLLLLVLGKASFVSAAWIKEEQARQTKELANKNAIAATLYSRLKINTDDLLSVIPLLPDLSKIVIDYLKVEDEAKLKEQILSATKDLLTALELNDIESMEQIILHNIVTPSVDWLNEAGNSALMIASAKNIKEKTEDL